MLVLILEVEIIVNRCFNTVCAVLIPVWVASVGEVSEVNHGIFDNIARSFSQHGNCEILEELGESLGDSEGRVSHLSLTKSEGRVRSYFIILTCSSKIGFSRVRLTFGANVGVGINPSVQTGRSRKG